MSCGRPAPSPSERDRPVGDGGRIRLRVPAVRAFAQVAPLTASGLAERFGFTAAEIAGLCDALDTTIAALVGGAGPGTPRAEAGGSGGDMLDVAFTVWSHQVVVHLSAEPRRLSAATWQALGATVSPWVTSFEAAGAAARISLTGRAGTP